LRWHLSRSLTNTALTMKKITCKAAILGVLVLGCLEFKDYAYNGPAPTPSVEFKAREAFSEGFDPPLSGDTDTATGAADEGDWVPHTSIARSGPDGVNERCKLVLPSNEAAALYEIVVAANSTQLISVTPSAPSGVNINIRITSLADGAIVQKATIQARLTSDHTTVVAQLYVLLLPVRTTVQCKFYRVSNLNDNEFIENPTENPVASPGEATAEADSRMRQAVVSVSPAPPDPPVYGDFSKRTLGFDLDGNQKLSGDNEYQVFVNSGMFTGKCNVIYVSWLAEGYGGMVFDVESKLLFIAQNAWTFPGGGFSDDPEDGSSASSQMERLVAHEFGHYLKLCSRTINLGAGDPRRGHDDYPLPSGTATLMRGGDNGGGRFGRWMRHEDWVQANITAGVKTQ